MAANCSVHGVEKLDEESGSKMWIGWFVIFCSVVSTALMGMDVFRSIYRWKNWGIRCKYFSFNAATITLWGYATLIGSDTNEPMPGFLDQLLKVSSVILICVSMNHTMTSFGTTDDGTTFANLIALGTLIVATSFAMFNQFKTHLISDAYGNYIFSCTIYMIVIFIVLVTHALTVPTFKNQLEAQFESRSEEILTGVKNDSGVRLTTNTLERYIRKYWLMAVTCNPEYVSRASALSLIVSFWCFNLSILLISALLVSNDFGKNECYTKSKFKKRVIAIVCIQGLAIALGAITSTLRLFTTLVFKSNLRNFTWKKFFWIEDGTLRVLGDLLDRPVPSENRAKMFIAYGLKIIGSVALVLLKGTVTILSWPYLFVVRANLSFVYLPKKFFHLLEWLFKCWKLCLHHAARREDVDSIEQELSPNVLGIDGVVEAGDITIADKRKRLPRAWRLEGERKTPHEFNNLVQGSRSCTSRGRTIGKLCIEMISNEEFKVVNNCWTLQVMTIARIIKAGFRERDNGQQSLKKLNRALQQGFRYVMLIDRNVANTPEKTRQAAVMVWEKYNYRCTRMTKCCKLCCGSDPFARTIEKLEEDSEKDLRKYKDEKNLKRLPPKAIAARSMSNIIAIMRGIDANLQFNYEEMEEALVTVFKKSMENLPWAILKQCSQGCFGTREEEVRLAALILGETEEIRDWFESEEDGRTNEGDQLESDV